MYPAEGINGILKQIPNALKEAFVLLYLLYQWHLPMHSESSASSAFMSHHHKEQNSENPEKTPTL